jgi:hypothetical protein
VAVQNTLNKSGILPSMTQNSDPMRNAAEKNKRNIKTGIHD